MTKILLIIRHAERPAIEDGTVGNGLALTQNGIIQTTKFAESLNRKILSIDTSPILRCTQTADIIAKNHGFPFPSIGHSTLLGDPGFLSKTPNWRGRIGLKRGLMPLTSIS